MAKLYERIAGLVIARENCRKSGNTEWFQRHAESIETLVKVFMPSGSGFDSGTLLSLDESEAEKLVFCTSFHHHGEHGYSHWSSHDVIVTPSLYHGINLRITGRDYNGFKDYCHDCFYNALMLDISDDHYKRLLCDEAA